MAITTNEVIKLVDCVGGQIIESGSSVIAFSKYDSNLGAKSSYVITLQEDGEMFQIYNMLGNPSSVGITNLGSLNSLLLNHSANTKFGTWELDDDGDIRYSVEFPLEDNTLTEKQFKRIVGVVENSTTEFLKLAKDTMSSNESGI